MNTHRTSVSFRRAGQLAAGSLLALALLVSPRAEATENQLTARAADPVIKRDHTGWGLNATPVLIVPENGYGWGGGADPELRYSVALGWARMSVGGRIGAYYAADRFGLSAMPTLRLMVPVGNLEPYVSGGVGYGWLTDSGHTDVATMARAGFLYRFSKKFALGLEGTLQQVHGSPYRFPSVGSMMAFDL